MIAPAAAPAAATRAAATAEAEAALRGTLWLLRGLAATRMDTVKANEASAKSAADANGTKEISTCQWH